MDAKLPGVGHHLIRVQPDRMTQFAERYEAWCMGRPTAQAALLELLNAWRRADHRALGADLVTLTDRQKKVLDSALTEASTYLDPLDDEEALLIRRLRQGVPNSMVREALTRLRRRLARSVRLEELRAPQIVIANETQLVAQALAPWGDEPLGSPVGAGASIDAGDLLIDALLLCRPLNDEGNNLGVGLSDVVRSSIELTEANLDEMADEENWGPSFARFPWVPRRRLYGQAGLEAAGPLGFAVGDEVFELALAIESLDSSSVFGSCAHRIRGAGKAGWAVVGWLEYFSVESEGHGRFIDSDDSPLLPLDG